MNDRQQKIRELFDEAIEIESHSERHQFVDQACHGDQELQREVYTLLNAHAGAGSFLDSPPKEIQPTVAAAGAQEEPGTQIGPYKLLQKLGEGGFGVVYMAQQTTPIRRKVALKIIKQGMDTQQVIARFEAERQALAMMEHPNIAKVLDAGATEAGRPYFVMELVRGDPITHYCDRERLDTEARLRLFRDVCHAVQHAHQKGIIHRDIKPSNVMVTLHDGKPVPKVIDFGIAKATQQDLTEKTLFTEYGQFIGTPAYMSPEQAEMSGLGVDTRSDIYSLGVLLYELLTGTTPFEAAQFRRAAIDEIIRMIRQDEPPRPSLRLSTLAAMQRSQGKPHAEEAAEVAVKTSSIEDIARSRHADPFSLAKSLSGDLDWIVMKTLEKDRSRRYGTAIELASDVQRHLQDEPVLASPPSTTYRVRKYVRRNRGFVIAISAVAASLIVGFATMGIGFAQARQGQAEARRGQAEAQRDRDRAQHDRDRAVQAEKDAIQAKDNAIKAEKELREAELSFTKEFFFSNLWRGDFQTAEEMLARAQDFGATETWVHNGSAMLAQFQGDAATARKELDLVLRSSPNNTLAFALLSMVDYWDGDEIAWMEAVEDLHEQNLDERTYDEKLIVAYTMGLGYPKEAIEILTDLETDHRNYPVVRLLRAMALRYRALFCDDLGESQELLQAALEDLNYVEGSLRHSPLAFQALITINLQARDVWRKLAVSDADRAGELNDEAKSFEQTAIQYADEAVVQFPRSFEAMWACLIAFQETGEKGRLADLIAKADLPHNHPFWNQTCALYWLGLGRVDEANQTMEKMQDHPLAAVARFHEHWIQICDAQASDATFRDGLKQEVLRYAENKIASGKGGYLFLDLSTLLMLGEREKVRELASRATDELKDVLTVGFQPGYDILIELDFDPAKLRDRWPSYDWTEGPGLLLGYLDFYAACDAIGQGNPEAARESFQSCIEHGWFFTSWHWASRAYLSRLDDGWPQWIGSPE
ncbi:serine/threonine protein kinase [Novipirellula artificiosorum]|uniref:Serine/threonine-protein kinase Pkn1 n=1 Tax=Novipirellula artificiosorum TaxID=2528016 RepID=A0A5C6CVL0_9BACT|nr:serine/threonine-protein kinase [Novipirellula artificiosorum]TWU28993.1 Serine/threonine-protein kinase Pkn1 [Novipirellula artificiosorum]